MSETCAMMRQVRSIIGNYVFFANAHLTENRSERCIDQQFYDDYCNGGFDGNHIEFHLIQPRVWNLPQERWIHTHRTPDGRQYMCWTGHLPTIAGAMKIFTMWCAGTVYTIEHHKDFAQLYGGDPDECLRRLARDYGIVVAG